MGLIEIIKSAFVVIFLQTSWSYVGRQTLGILYAIILLSKDRTDNSGQGPTKKQLKERIWQKMSLNTNPYCAGVILGIALNKQGEIFKESFFSMQHIFGSIGDEFFWHLLRPTLVSLAVVMLFIGYFYSHTIHTFSILMFSPLLFLIPYNIIAQGTRIRGLYQGKKYGKNAAISLIEMLRKPIPKLYNILAYIMGVLLIFFLLIFLTNFSGQINNLVCLKHLIRLFLGIFIIVISYILLRSERASSYLLISGLLIFLVIKLL